jgi:hypothetical protein
MAPTDTNDHFTTVEKIMSSHGYDTHHTGGGYWVWQRQTEDGSNLWIATSELGLECDPDEPAWSVGRYNNEGGAVQCDDYVPLADALAIAVHLAPPRGKAKIAIPRKDLEPLALRGQG